MNIIKKELSRSLKSIEIHSIADEHLGDKNCDTKNLIKRIDYIKNTPNAYCIVNGDLLNNATKTSVSDTYSEQLSPMEQIMQGVELLEPIRDKILSIQTGNHEVRTYKKEGIDLMEIVARELKLQDIFSCTSSFLFLKFGEASRGWKESKDGKNIRMICYTIFVNHGSGGGRKEGAKAIRLADMASIVDADIYIHSHTHLPMTMKQAFYRVDIPNSNIAICDKLFVNTASNLNYGGYGEQYEFKPNSKQNPVIYLNGTRKEFTALL